MKVLLCAYLFINSPSVFFVVTLCVCQTEISAQTYEIVTETIIIREATTKTVVIPATYKIEYDTEVVESARTILYGTKSNPQRRTTPAITKTTARKTVLTPHGTKEIMVPALTKQVTRKVLISQ